LQMEDSSYVVTGSSSSFTGGVGSQAYIMRIDSLGNYKWSHHYGGSESDVGKRVFFKNNFGFFITGFTNSIGDGAYDFWLVKTDDSGVEEWEKSYGDFGWERLHDAVMTKDTGVLMVGETSSNPTNNKDMYIVRTNSAGDTLWTKTLGSDLGDDVLTSIDQYNDSIYFVAGHTYHLDSLKQKPFVMKLHEDGTIFWMDTFFMNGNSVINDIHIYNDELMGVGSTDKNTSDFLYNSGLRLDLSTSVPTTISEWTEGSSGERIMHQITTYGDLGKRYIAYSYFGIWSNPDARDVAVGRFSDAFSWQQTLLSVAYFGPEDLNHLIRTSDGGAIAVGKTRSHDFGAAHVFVAKIGPNEMIPDWTGVPHDIETLVSIDEASFVKDVRIYPVPASQELIVETPISDEVGLQLLNSMGQIIWTGEVINSTAINVSEIPSGLYWLRMTTNDGQSGVRKISVQR
ncbi:MAG: T9SS type A sorting domain-containing protein, partial [Crocinitomicaceae bacterium]|nr:T9SS type A sorting domain-containing protein [Crocinitomicaceae bacterium]